VRTILLVLFILLSGQRAVAGVTEVVIEGNIPINFMIGANGYYVNHQVGTAIFQEKVQGISSLMPLARAGVSFTTDNEMKIEALAGAGYMTNAAFSAGFYNADLALLFKYGRKVYVGPHVGVVGFNAADWKGNNDIKFDKTTGFIVGVASKSELGKYADLNYGLDYMSAKFKVASKGAGVTVSDSKLDASGILLLMGISLHF
jgi:hypothetical protein